MAGGSSTYGGRGGDAGVSGQNGGAALGGFAGGLGGTAPGGDGGDGASSTTDGPADGGGGGGGGGAYGEVVSSEGVIAPANGGNGGNAGGTFSSGVFNCGGGGGGEGARGASVTVSGAFSNPGGAITGGTGGHGGGALDSPGDGGSGGTGIFFALGSVTFDNSGSITGGDGGGGGYNFYGGNASNGADAGVGIDFAGYANELRNFGSIRGGNGGVAGVTTLETGYSGTGGAGVRGTGLDITNSGSIRGGDGDVVAGAGITGSDLAITNSGSIVAGLAGGARSDALALTGGSNTLTLLRGSAITGDIDLQAGSLAVQVDRGLASVIDGAFEGDGSLLKTGGGRLTITGAIRNDAGMTVRGGVLAFDSSVTGAGSATLEAGAKLQLGGADAQDTYFAGANAILELVDPASYSGTLFGLAASDMIALDDVTVTSARVHGTTLTVETEGEVLTFQLARHAVFKYAVDLTGDSVLTVVPSIAWARGQSGDWQAAANWKPALSPTVNDNAQISVAGTYTITSSADNAVNDLSLGNATATLAIAGGTTFEVAGHRVGNNGTIALGGAASGATLAFNTDATLIGSGTVRLSDSADNLIAQAGLDDVTLTNGSTVAGAGRIGRGDGHLTFVNTSVVDADQSLALVIHTGNTVVNSGTLEATGGGGLVILDAVENRRHGLFANGGDVTVAGAVTGTGAASIDGATLEFESASSARVKFLGTAGQLTLDDSAAFGGTVAGLENGPGNVIDFADISFASVAGTFHERSSGTKGTLALSDGTHSASLSLLGQHAASFTMAPAAGYTGFVLADDGSANHGTLVSYRT